MEEVPLMSHFHERVLNNTIDYQKELEKLKYLLEKETFHDYSIHWDVSTIYYLNYTVFRQLPLSTNYISLFDLLDDIREEDDRAGFLAYSEMVLSLACQLLPGSISLGDCEQQVNYSFKYAIKVIDYDLNKLSLKYEFIDTDAGKVAMIIPKDILLETVLDHADDDLSANLIRYKSLKMEGNVIGKEEILLSLSKAVEPILKDESLKSINERLFKDVGFMLNNFDLRHNNKESNVQKFYYATLPEREKWLDNLYFEILLVLNSKHESVIHKTIESLKGK